jgi:ferrous iron transport protein B
MFALLSIVWSLGLAWIVSFMFYQSARWLGF